MKHRILWRALSLVCLLVLPLIMRATPDNVAPVAAQEVESFDNEAFVKPFKDSIYAAAYNRKPQSQAELWKLMERLGKAIQQTRDPQKQRLAAFDYGYLAGAILRQGEAADYQRLIQIYQSLPRESWARQVMIQPLGDYWIKHAITALEKSGPHPALKIAAANAALPPEAQAASPELQNAYRQYKACAAAFDEALKEKPQDGWVGVQQNWPLFYDAAGDFFTGKTQNMVPRLASFRWGGWCGTGDEMLYGPKNRLLFMSLLQERRYAPAIGALFPLMSQGRGVLGGLETNDDWKQRFLRWCGQDWETIFAGAALDRQETLSELARYGSPKAARLLVQMADVPKMGERQDYLNAVAAFIKPGDVPTGYGTSSSDDIKRLAPEPIPDDLQQQLLKILGDRIRPGTSLYSLQTATHILVDKARPESKEALRRLLKMPYGELREKAALALRAFGEDVKVEPIKPLVFRLLRNGKAAPNLAVQWEIRAADGAISSEADTDQNGTFQLKRAALVDAPQAPRFLFAAKDMKSPNDLWFEVQRAKPADLDDTTDVPIETGSLTLQLKLPRPAAFYEGKKLLLQVNAERPLSETSYFRPINNYEKMALPFQSEIHFPALQKRTYEIELFVPGAVRWSEKIPLDNENKKVEVNLQKGADLKFQVIAPGGEARDKTPQPILLRDGKELNSYLYIDYAAQTYRGLPTGHYTLKIASSAEKQKRYSSRDGQRITTPAYEGAERAFVINENSSPAIDLGNIALRPAKPTP